MAEEGRLEHLLEMRDSLLQEMAEADLEFSRVRMRVEQMESDMRIGRATPHDFQRAKGQLLPQAEARVLDAFRNLLKLEDRINASRR